MRIRIKGYIQNFTYEYIKRSPKNTEFESLHYILSQIKTDIVKKKSKKDEKRVEIIVNIED